jgi:hypothetical protein
VHLPALVFKSRQRSQELSNPNSQSAKTVGKHLRLLVGAAGVIFNVIEVTSYAIFFRHIVRHDNTVAARYS